MLAQHVKGAEILDKAIGEEDFETAAELRDEIKATKEKISSISVP